MLPRSSFLQHYKPCLFFSLLPTSNLPSSISMSFFQMPIPFPSNKDHVIGRKSTEIMSSGGGDAAAAMVGEGSAAADFWPIQHPIAPPPGDKPVACPFPNSSLVNEWRREPMSKRRHSVSHEGDQYRRLLFPPTAFNAPSTFTFNKF